MKRYGLCCISNRLHEKGFSFQTITKTNLLKLSSEKRTKAVLDILVNNLEVTLEHFRLCIDKGWVYRMSSSLFPFVGLPEFDLSWDLAVEDERVDDLLFCMANCIKNANLRVSLHPDQFVVLASSKPYVVENSIRELEAHGDFMNFLKLPESYDCPINIHMNSYIGRSLEEITGTFAMAFGRLSARVQQRLVLENEDKRNSWNVEQLYKHIYNEFAIPITYDCLHYRCNPGSLSATEALVTARSTWRQSRPLFHFSGGEPDSNNPRAHSDYPYGVPVEFWDADNIDLDMEFKMKDRAIEKLQAEYPQRL